MTPLYAGIGGVVRELTEMYTGVDGVVKPMTEMWAGVGGVNRQIFSAVSGKQASEYAIGDTVYLNENGQNTPFIVSAQNYEASLNGNGRTLLVRNTWLPQTMAWDTSDGDIWSEASLDTWLNTTYLNYFDQKTQSAIGTTKFKYYSSGAVYPWSSATIGTLERAIFMLSVPELVENNTDYSDRSYYSDGEQLAGAALLINKFANTYVWTRTPSRKIFPYTPNGACVLTDNTVADEFVVREDKCYAIPVLTVSADTQFDPETNIMI